jgi:hypothetical protein
MGTSRPASPPGLQSAVGAWLGARNQTRWLSPSRQSPPIHQTRLRLAQDRRSPVPRLLSGARRSRSMANCGPDDVEVFDALHRRGTVSRLCCTPWTFWTSTARTCPLRRWATARSGWRGSWVVRYRCCNHPPRHAREAFKEGYLAGWRSIRGAASPPPISCFTAPLPGETPFRVGFILGVRDGWRGGSPSGASSNIDDWIMHLSERFDRTRRAKTETATQKYRFVPSSRRRGSSSPRL